MYLIGICDECGRVLAVTPLLRHFGSFNLVL